MVYRSLHKDSHKFLGPREDVVLGHLELLDLRQCRKDAVYLAFFCTFLPLLVRWTFQCTRQQLRQSNRWV